jgi:hypothetical protein
VEGGERRVRRVGGGGNGAEESKVRREGKKDWLYWVEMEGSDWVGVRGGNVFCALDVEDFRAEFAGV